MKGRSPLGLLLLCCVGAIVALAVSPRAAAQGCAACYQSASAAGPRAIHALRNGILILMIPPGLICSAISFLAYRRRNVYSNN